MTTTASAQGNASAILNVISSSPPEICPFEATLTEEMELLHFINNEDVMEHAEEIQSLIAANEASQSRWDRMNSKQRMRNGAIPLAIERRTARIPELEDLILAEIDEAQAEYRMLAQALCEGREGYIAARDRVGMAPITNGTQRVINRTGRSNAWPEMNGQTMHTILNYERYHDSYKLLEAGFAHVTTQEQVERILTVIGRELLIEVVTLGLAKYVRVVRAGLAALDEAAAAIAGAGKALIVSRYQALSPATRERLGRLYQRREADRRVQHPTDGTTGQGQGPRRADPDCGAGFVLCNLP